LQSSAFVIAVFEFVLLIFSLSVHECAHAWMASRLGDQTARMQGRVTLNPMYHMDPIGTLLFPAIMIFGPLIGFSMFGPVSNLLIVLVAFIGMAVLAHVLPNGHEVVISSFIAALSPGDPYSPHPLVLLCTLAILINLSLCFFNLLPIPPLDGSHILRNALPYNGVQVYDRIPTWASYLLMIFVGGFILRMLLNPALEGVYFGLLHI